METGAHINAAANASGQSGEAAAEVARAAIAAWEGVHASLSPVIGSNGVSALYKRSVHLAQKAHPCLNGADGGPPGPAQFEMLRTLLSGQSEARTASRASEALLQTFRDLLVALIGPKLTQQLLEPTAPGQRLTTDAATPPGTDHHDR